MSTLTQFFGAADQTVPCELLIVGGGGAGGYVGTTTNCATGGGGSGELIYYTGVRLQRGFIYNWSVGAGGTSTTSSSTNGGNSSFGTLIAGGGGFGASLSASNYVDANPGVQGLFPSTGSGGGGAVLSSSTSPGAGNVSATSVIDPQDIAASVTNLSGAGTTGTNGFISGTGGGAVGTSGYILSITGTSVTYAVGGGSASFGFGVTGAAGGANTGSGGGGSGGNSILRPGGAGGSGVIIIAYPSIYGAPSAITGTYTTPTRSNYLVYSLNSGTGTFRL